MFIVVSSLALGWGVYRYFHNKREPSIVRTLPQGTDMEMKNLRFTEVSSSRVKWELSADSGRYSKENSIVQVNGVKFILNELPFTGTMTVTANSGEYDQQARKVTLIGNVIASSVKGMTFKTDRILYDSNLRKFTTKEKIFFSDSALTLDGIGLEMLVDTQQVKVLRQVSATITPGKMKK